MVYFLKFSTETSSTSTMKTTNSTPVSNPQEPEVEVLLPIFNIDEMFEAFKEQYLQPNQVSVDAINDGMNTVNITPVNISNTVISVSNSGPPTPVTPTPEDDTSEPSITPQVEVVVSDTHTDESLKNPLTREILDSMESCDPPATISPKVIFTRRDVGDRHRAITTIVYQVAKRLVQMVMEEDLKFHNFEYEWCIAGGFASFVAGVTNTFGDVDIFVMLRRRMPAMFALKVDVFDWKFDIVVRPSVSYINRMATYCGLLTSFDLDICRYALIGERELLHVVVSHPHIRNQLNGRVFESSMLNDASTKDRRKKYRARVQGVPKVVERGWQTISTRLYTKDPNDDKLSISYFYESEDKIQRKINDGFRELCSNRAFFKLPREFRPVEE